MRIILLLMCFTLFGCTGQSKTERDVEAAKRGTWKVEYIVDGKTKQMILLGERPSMITTGGGIGVANNTVVVRHEGERVLSLPVSAHVSITEVEERD